MPTRGICEIMKRSIFTALALGALLGSPLATHAAAMDAAPSGKPTAAEAPFVAMASAYLRSRYATTAAAEQAGFVRYTNEDDTGAISYANKSWTSSDYAHPSQLWYDVHGKLLGADYSVPQTDAAPPKLFGVDPARWQKFGLHDHYGLAGSGGSIVYGDTGAKKVTAIGGDPTAPTAGDLVKLKIAKAPSDVKFVFAFPKIWDLAVWVVPNPLGAFSEKNPNVTPVSPPKSMDDGM